MGLIEVEEGRGGVLHDELEGGGGNGGAAAFRRARRAVRTFL